MDFISAFLVTFDPFIELHITRLQSHIYALVAERDPQEHSPITDIQTTKLQLWGNVQVLLK